MSEISPTQPSVNTASIQQSPSTLGRLFGHSSPSPKETPQSSQSLSFSWFLVSFGINTATRAILMSDTFNKILERHGLNPIPEKLYFPIGTAVNFGALYTFSWAGLMKAPSLSTLGIQTLPFMGFNTALPFVIDGTLGSIPHLETFQTGKIGNSWLTYGTVFWNSLRLYTRTGWAAKVITVAEETGAVSYKLGRAGWAGVAILMGITATKLLDMMIDGVDSTVSYFQTRDLNRSVRAKKVAELEMEELVWQRSFQQAAQNVLGRSFGGYVNSVGSSIGKQFSRINQALFASKETQETFVIYNDIIRAKMMTEFNEWARLNIAKLVADSTYQDKSQNIQIDWERAEIEIRKLYDQKPSNPNKRSDLTLFYHYDYEAHPIDAKWFPDGKNHIQEIKDLTYLVSDDGTLDLRVVDDPSTQEEVRQKKISLIHLAIKELDQRYQELAKEYPDEDWNCLNESEILRYPKIVEYRDIEQKLFRLSEVKLNLQVESFVALFDEAGNIRNEIKNLDEKITLVRHLAKEMKEEYTFLRRKYDTQILEEPIKSEINPKDKADENQSQNLEDQTEPSWIEKIQTSIDQYRKELPGKPDCSNQNWNRPGELETFSLTPNDKNERENASLPQEDKSKLKTNNLKTPEERKRELEIKLYRDRYKKLLTLEKVDKALIVAQSKRVLQTE